VNKNDVVAWYDKNVSNYKVFCEKIETLIKEIVSIQGIDVHSITSRVKEKESLLKKCDKKGYKDVSEITDVIGIRIVTFILEDVQKICTLLENEFVVDGINSGDKFNDLKVNETGYLSYHYTLRLGASRCALSEYARFKDTIFEIQVRTLLQHAWASMSHENQYKFSGVLPSEINRRFYLTAGTLELLDIEFQRLSDELRKEKSAVDVKIQEGNLDIEINSTSLLEYLDKQLICLNNISIIQKTFNDFDEYIIEELTNLGINTIRDLDKIFLNKVIEVLNEITERESYASPDDYVDILRCAMIIFDANKYFDYSWDSDTFSIDIYSFNILSKHVSCLKDIQKNRSIDLMTPKH